MLKEKGILIFSVGHPQYGRLAYNNALTLKNAGQCNIAIVRTENSLNHLSIEQQEIFDYIIDLPDGVPVGCGAKMWAYDISPFEKTILLDADMLWLPEKKPDQLFDELEGVSFTAITEGYDPGDVNKLYFFWANVDEIREVYPIESDRLYQWRSEVMYFERSEQIEDFFATAKAAYLSPNLKSEKSFGEVTADELALVIAAGVHDIHPHQYKWWPSYWHLMNNGQIPEFGKLYREYWLVSFGARFASQNSKQLYDRLVKAACYKMGVQHVFPLIAKKEYLKSRQHI